jgi:hypothetical protein
MIGADWDPHSELFLLFATKNCRRLFKGPSSGLTQF